MFDAPRAIECEDLDLALGQRRQHGRRRAAARPGAAQGEEQSRRHPWIDPRPAVGDGADRPDDVVGRRVLEEEAGGAGLDGAPEHVVVVERREHEHRRTASGADPARRFEPVEHRHAHVHQHDVGTVVGDGDEPELAVAGLRGDDDARLGREDERDAGPHERLVVDEDDGQRPLGGLFRHGGPPRAHRCARAATPRPTNHRRGWRPRRTCRRPAHPLAHAPRPEPGASGARRRRRRWRAVADPDLHALAVVGEHDGRRRTGRVLQHVGQRLLHDPVDHQLDRRVDDGAAVHRQGDVEARPAVAVDEIGDAVQRRLRQRRARGRIAQQPHHLADRVEAVATDHLGARQRLVGPLRIGGQRLAGSGEVEHDDRQRVGDDVVDVHARGAPARWPPSAPPGRRASPRPAP